MILSGIFGAQIAGAIVASLYLIWSEQRIHLFFTGDTQELLAALDSHPLLLAFGAQAGLLLFGLLWMCIRLWPRISRQVGFRSFSPLNAVAMLGLILPIQILSQPLMIWAGELLPDNGLEFTEELRQLIVSAPIGNVLIVVALLPAIGEEILFRGLIGTALVRNWGVALGVSGATVSFAVMHVHPVHALAVVPLGIMLHSVYLSTKSLWAPIFLHLCNNAFAVIMTRWEDDLILARAFDSDAGIPSNSLLITAATTLGLIMIWLWTTRVQFRYPDGRLYNPGYVSISPPHSVENSEIVELVRGSNSMATWLISGMAVASLGLFCYLLYKS